MADQADHADDLDALLDSALEDFQSLNLSSSRSGDGAEKKQEVVLMPSGVQGLGMGLPDLRSKKDKRKQKAPKDNSNHAAETLDKLREQTREAVKGLETLSGGDDLGNNEMMDWVKQFEELTGSQDMESMVETMMQQLLSKDILHEPMKEIREKYPKWLADHEATLTEEDMKRYSIQYELIKELNEVYENDANNYTKIIELMQKMQECGQPPDDIIQEVAPDFDISNLGQLLPEMLDPSQPSCCIM